MAAAATGSDDYCVINANYRAIAVRFSAGINRVRRAVVCTGVFCAARKSGGTRGKSGRRRCGRERGSERSGNDGVVG
jgi:hypothetical protein